MRKLLVFLFLCLFPPAPFADASAFPGLVEAAPECRCQAGVADPFEQPVRYSYGACQGQCLDTCRFRDPRILGGLDREWDKYIILANLLHRHRYWRARVPAAEVSRVDVVFEDFLKGVSHVALRFHFASPVLLESQAGERALSWVRDLVFSPEGTPPKGQDLDLMQAALGDYILTYRLLSAWEMADWTIRVKRHTVRQYELQMDAEERARLFKLVLRASAERKFSNPYALFSNNCATTTTDLLAEATGKSAPYWQWPARAISLDANVGTLYWLESAGLVDSRRPVYFTDGPPAP